MRTVSRVAKLVPLLVVAACTTPSDQDAPDDVAVADLAGRRFVSTEVLQDGEAAELFAGTDVAFNFGPSGLTVQADCNSIETSPRIERGRLLTGDSVGVTDAGCPPRNHEQDEWLMAFVGAEPAVTLEGDVLTLEVGKRKLSLVDDRTITRPLLDTTWALEEPAPFVRVPGLDPPLPPFVRFREGNVNGFTGCNHFDVPAVISDTSITVDVAVLQLPKPCENEQQTTVEASMLDVLGSAAAVTFEGDVLRLESDRGALAFRAVDE